MRVLAIESSCDETSVAIVDSAREILSNAVLSQAAHTAFGGVIPEVASREHVRTIVPLYEQALRDADSTLGDIDLIAATHGPGLVGPLLVGLSFAKGLAFATGKPFVPVNHLEGHLAANLLAHPDLDARHLCLIVSGGHTLLVAVERFAEYTVLGQTRDDAAGEAFDKVAKIMGLGYPGGAALDKLAATGNPEAIAFPRAMRKEPYAFSFSGVKTAVSLYLDRLNDDQREAQRADVAASFQEAVVDSLVEKTINAAQEHGFRHISVTGGVAANSRLRTKMSEAAAVENRRVFVPPLSLCGDNAAMIAAAGFLRHELFGPGELIANAIPNLPLVVDDQ